ncbi:MAG: hypothetical protein ACJ74M_01215 [Gaiellaceae bacterium]|jgi:hypothetical protein
MGSASFKQIAGGLAIAVLLVAVHLMPGRGNQALRHDHAREWSYLKVPHSDPTPLESRLGEIASLVAGRPVQVRCEDFPIGTGQEPGGVVQFKGSTPADYARIRPDYCTALMQFVRAPASARFKSVVAAEVLTHESFHLQGVKTEAVAECYAMQSVSRVAHALGASLRQGRTMAMLTYEYVYPRMPPQYRSPDCRPGGSLDRHPGGDWPA